ncbi:hypothetical protein M9H77_03690 [Catharanthus roseus]|uniref:Uncharacterized protein n=1 Tax=Catharanthus roseus TaxID=4058 RepID=A0ACC0CBX1_CATRO|nr:hypothetical protein M9H77_03690 [Catharanthus roseus]
MMRLSAKLPAAARVTQSFSLLRPPCPLPVPPLHFRFFTGNNKTESFVPSNPVAHQMINYALNLARSQKSDESYAQGLLVLEQCHSTQSDDNSKGMVLLAMSTLLYERGNFIEAIEKLQSIQDLSLSSVVVREWLVERLLSVMFAAVAATEALVGLDLELDQDDSASVLAEICFQLMETIKLELADANGLNALEARAKAIKGLVKIARGDIESAEPFFLGLQDDNNACTGNVALSYAEYLHGLRKLPIAKELYQKVIQGMSQNQYFSNLDTYAACNMAKDEVLLAATCGLGQLEAHSGNFGDAEETLTGALKKAEDHFGSRHPKVGVILTCIALMFRQKATIERSSSLLIQEGLYRRAIELLKAPALETKSMSIKMSSGCSLA